MVVDRETEHSIRITVRWLNSGREQNVSDSMPSQQHSGLRRSDRLSVVRSHLELSASVKVQSEKSAKHKQCAMKLYVTSRRSAGLEKLCWVFRHAAKLFDRWTLLPPSKRCYAIEWAAPLRKLLAIRAI